MKLSYILRTWALIIAYGIYLSGCQSLFQGSKLTDDSTQLPVCKKEGITSRDFNMKYEVSENGTPMMVSSTHGFSCKTTKLGDDGFPLCEFACGSYEQKQDSDEYGYCPTGKTFECIDPDKVADQGKKGDQGKQGDQGGGGKDGLIEFETTYYPYIASGHDETATYTKTTCGDANSHGGLYFAVTEKSPLWNGECNEESWGDCNSDVCKKMLSQMPADSKKIINGVQKVREPGCQVPCGKRFKVYSADKKFSAEAVIWDACPANHWNNRTKEVRGQGNPCAKGKRHLDLRRPLFERLGGKSANIKIWVDPKPLN